VGAAVGAGVLAPVQATTKLAITARVPSRQAGVWNRTVLFLLERVR
jgi:hypothetical protein